MTPQLVQSLQNEWPKLVATGVLIPLIQWLANFAWQRRTKARVAQHRADIIALEEFISKHQVAVGGDDKAVQIAKAELAALIAELDKLSLPFAASNPRVRALARFFLLYPPKYAISFFPRFLFFSEFAAIILELYRLRHGFSHFFVIWGPVWFSHFFVIWGLVWSVLGLFVNHWLTRRADEVIGPIAQRSTWKRVTLLYRPVSLAAGFCQGWFLLCVTIATYLVVEGIVDDFEDFSDDPLSASITVGLLLAFIAFTWLMSRHLDRAIRATATPAAPQTLV